MADDALSGVHLSSAALHLSFAWRSHDLMTFSTSAAVAPAIFLFARTAPENRINAVTCIVHNKEHWTTTARERTKCWSYCHKERQEQETRRLVWIASLTNKQRMHVWCKQIVWQLFCEFHLSTYMATRNMRMQYTVTSARRVQAIANGWNLPLCGRSLPVAVMLPRSVITPRAFLYSLIRNSTATIKKEAPPRCGSS